MARACGTVLALTVAFAGPVLAVINFKLPFVCGETYTGTTNPQHPYGAIDFNQDNNADDGDPVWASASGTVAQIYPTNGQVHIAHAGGWETVYAHMANISVSVTDPVAEGQYIGNISDVGNAVGAHLHYQQLANSLEQLAKFDGVTYAYGTPITSTNCGSRAAPAMVYDVGNGSTNVYRSANLTGTNPFTYVPPVNTPSLDLANVGDRATAGDFDGDGGSDIAVAYQRPDGRFEFRISLHGSSTFTIWYTSGPFSLSRVGGRLVAGNWNGDSKDDLAMAYDNNDGTFGLYRWTSMPTGTGFTSYAPWESGSFYLSHVGDRMVAGDWNGGPDDVIMAYTNSNGSFTYHIWSGAQTYAGAPYTSGPFSLSRVAGRFVAGDWNADTKADLAMAYDNNNGTFGLYRWTATATGFTAYAPLQSGSFYLSNVDDRMSAGRFNTGSADDVVMAYQNSTGTFTYHVWSAASAYAGTWYTSGGSFTLSRVGGRLVAGRW